VAWMDGWMDGWMDDGAVRTGVIHVGPVPRRLVEGVVRRGRRHLVDLCSVEWWMFGWFWFDIY
jgi:hypothetical protein